MIAAKSFEVLRDPHLPGLESVHVTDSTHVFPMHAHDNYSVDVLTHGHCKLAEGERGMMHAGNVALINPGEMHTGEPQSDSVSYRTNYFPRDFILTSAEEVGFHKAMEPAFSVMTITNPLLKSLIWRLTEAILHNVSPLQKDSLISAISTRVLAYCGGTVPNYGNHPRAVRIAKEYLSANLGNTVRLEDLATVAGISRYHLLRSFKAATGLPPHMWQMQLRVERSRALLQTDMSIAEVACELGFTDQSHFTRRFKQYMGITPNQYRS